MIETLRKEDEVAEPEPPKSVFVELECRRFMLFGIKTETIISRQTAARALDPWYDGVLFNSWEYVPFWTSVDRCRRILPDIKDGLRLRLIVKEHGQKLTFMVKTADDIDRLYHGDLIRITPTFYLGHLFSGNNYARKLFMKNTGRIILKPSEPFVI